VPNPSSRHSNSVTIHISSDLSGDRIDAPVGPVPDALDTLGPMTDGQPKLGENRTMWVVIIAILVILLLIGIWGMNVGG